MDSPAARMILDAALITVGIMLGLTAAAIALQVLARALRWLGYTRPIWWLRARTARRRLHRS